MDWKNNKPVKSVWKGKYDFGLLYYGYNQPAILYNSGTAVIAQ